MYVSVLQRACVRACVCARVCLGWSLGRSAQEIFRKLLNAGMREKAKKRCAESPNGRCPRISYGLHAVRVTFHSCSAERERENWAKLILSFRSLHTLCGINFFTESKFTHNLHGPTSEERYL